MYLTLLRIMDALRPAPAPPAASPSTDMTQLPSVNAGDDSGPRQPTYPNVKETEDGQRVMDKGDSEFGKGGAGGEQTETAGSDGDGESEHEENDDEEEEEHKEEEHGGSEPEPGGTRDTDAPPHVTQHKGDRPAYMQKHAKAAAKQESLRATHEPSQALDWSLRMWGGR
jgi:hypothetical protein